MRPRAIQSFAPVEEVLVVARDERGGGQRSRICPHVDGADTERLRLPDGGGPRVDRLIAPPSGTLLGLVLTEVVEEGTPALLECSRRRESRG